ncbi:nuclease [Bartonella krasnovii]|uniref:nuclease n=1 Tax=Bartonella krasnovii TaxID=2267275 RepID=UPI001F4C9022|nr:nuclease [Bartonella krasnovii]UNF46805.1 nuclease [Bartonella krasnovii]UNF48433.1 nuclease [Bartonella krasnovii]
MIFFKKTSRSAFKYLIFIFFILAAVSYFRQNFEDFMQSPVVQNIKKVVEKQSQEPDLIVRNHDHKQEMPLSLESLSTEFYEENVPVYSGAIQVTSGVTFKMITPTDEGWRKRIVRDIRLYGVETCETRQFATRNGVKWPCGAFVTAWLVSKTIDKNVTCRQARVVRQVHYAQCFVDGVDLARLGLAEGLMVLTKDQHNFPSPADYKNLQLIAQKEKNGLWSSKFQQPEDWRRDHGSYNPIDHN